MQAKSRVNKRMPSTSQKQSIRILVFGHKEFSQLFGTMTTYFSNDAEFYIVDAIVGSINEASSHIERIKPDVVISAGSNAAYLQQNLSLPILSLPVTDADIIAAVSKAAKACRKVKLITYDTHATLVPVLERALNVEIEHHTYSTAKQAREQFYLLKTDSDTAVVGASLVCDLAAQNNLKSFMYYSAESCRDVIESAIARAKLEIVQTAKTSVFNWAMSDANVPLVIVDLKKETVKPNEAAQHYFELSSKETTSAFDKACLALCAKHRGLVSNAKRVPLFIGARDFPVLIHCEELSSSAILYADLSFTTASHDSGRETRSINNDSQLRVESQAMHNVLKKVGYFAQSQSNVLITGESGTGKELVARAIHTQSNFAAGEFVALNCSAIPSELFEGELFGHAQGAYTGARKGGRKGLIHAAQNGALFLDEVSELSFDQQAKLLRFIQERRYRPVGSNQEVSSHLKLIAATNKPLNQLIEKGSFRHDLFYRLNVLNINIPPLRHRVDDIAAIALDKLIQLFNRNGIKADSENIINTIKPLLDQYQWPGNVRELENILERLCASLLMVNNEQGITDLLLDVAPELNVKPTTESDSLIVAQQLELVAQAMEMFNGDKQQVADYLGMSQTTLWRRLKKLNQQQPSSLGEQHAEI